MTDELLAFLVIGSVFGFISIICIAVLMAWDSITTYKDKKEKEKEKEKRKLYEEFSKKVREEIIEYYDSTRS